MLVLVAAACGGDDDGDTTSTTLATDATEAPTEEPAPVADDFELVIGQAAPKRLNVSHIAIQPTTGLTPRPAPQNSPNNAHNPNTRPQHNPTSEPATRNAFGLERWSRWAMVK